MIDRFFNPTTAQLITNIEYLTTVLEKDMELEDLDEEMGDSAESRSPATTTSRPWQVTSVQSCYMVDTMVTSQDGSDGQKIHVDDPESAPEEGEDLEGQNGPVPSNSAEEAALARNEASKEKECLKRKKAKLRKSGEALQKCEEGRKTIPAADTAALELKSRCMKKAFDGAMSLNPEDYHIPAKSMQAAADALIGVTLPEDHPLKEKFDTGMELLKNVVVMQNKYALAKSHVGTSSDVKSSANQHSEGCAVLER